MGAAARIVASGLIAAVSVGLLHLTGSMAMASRALRPAPGLQLTQSPLALDTPVHIGDRITVGVVARNTCDHRVRIIGASTSCTCTLLASDLPISLDPGSQATILFRIHVGAAGPDGNFTRAVLLLVDSGNAIPPFKLSVRPLTEGNTHA
jgi:hypothetical protein